MTPATPPPACRVFTIGHSTRTQDEFLALLRAHGVERLADIRTFPGSRRHPHFGRESLSAFLATNGIQYRHFPALGGRRTPRADSINTGWRHPSFRGYADYMQTPAFARGVDDFLAFAGHAPAAVMCAEAVWWQCHRQLLADALLARGVPVCHILSAAEAKPHRLSEFARVERGGVTYPGLL
ncbi:MAG TPA: DUF488 domain-containing protein [Vicinamibacterales bacterium]|nr:DUF488 domain-containing protein [Vicinamibacterales bacterium]